MAKIMFKDTLLPHSNRVVPTAAVGLVFIFGLALTFGLASCRQEADSSGTDRNVPDHGDPNQEGLERQVPQPSPSDKTEPVQPGPLQPALPRDSMVEAMIRIQWAEAYRARYYVLHAGASADPPLMDSLYTTALASLGISLARYEAHYLRMLNREPMELQALYDSCESILQRRLIGLR